MVDTTRKNLPELFGWLTGLGCLREAELCTTGDGFWAVTAPLAELLARRGITTVPDSRGEELECGLFFDDWYLYGVWEGTECTYSLFKMREQEYDKAQGRRGDGDTPGVTVPFVSLQTEFLRACLQQPTAENRMRLDREINRVVAYKGQHHSPVLKRYFIRTEAKGPYLMAGLYTGYIASLAQNGAVPVPRRYAQGGRDGRVSRFIEENNRAARQVICDHERIYIGDPQHPTERERLAILATHTGNTSFYSFAAEVQFHARFLCRWLRALPIVGRTLYASALRADMSIGDAEFTGPTPYYRANSRMVREQRRRHNERDHMEQGG